MSVGSVISCVVGALGFVFGEISDFILSIDPEAIFLVIAPYLNVVILGSAIILIVEAVVKGALHMGEALLVSILYVIGLPGIILGCLLVKRRSRLHEAAQAEARAAAAALEKKPALLLDLRLFRRLSWRETPERDDMGAAKLSAEQRVDTALIELGVPLSASDEEIRRAYRKLLLENHPDLIPHAPLATQERARKATLKIRCAYDTAIGRRTMIPEQ